MRLVIVRHAIAVPRGTPDIPDEDRPTLLAAGVAEIFTPGASTQDIVAWVHANVRPRAL